MNNIDAPWSNPEIYLKLNQILHKEDLVAGQSYLLIQKMITDEVRAEVSWWQGYQHNFFNGMAGAFEDYMVFELPTTQEELKKQRIF